MLEEPALIIGAWEGDPCDPRRAVYSADRRQPLGHVSGPAPTPGWLASLRARTLRVLESEDASLLMSVCRSWGLGRTWQVFDAEERRVGVVGRTILRDGQGHRRALIERADGQGSGRFLGT